MVISSAFSPGSAGAGASVAPMRGATTTKAPTQPHRRDWQNATTRLLRVDVPEEASLQVQKWGGRGALLKE